MFLLAYVFILSILSFIQMGVDKKRAKNKEWRIPEKSLWFLALIGGAPGSFFGMLFFRHKTKRWNFKIGFFLLMIVDLAIIILFEWINTGNLERF